MYYKRRKEDENRLLITRKDDLFLAPYQCKKIWFVNICERLLMRPSVRYRQTLNMLRMANLNIFCSWYTATVKVILRCTKEKVRSER